MLVAVYNCLCQYELNDVGVVDIQMIVVLSAPAAEKPTTELRIEAVKKEEGKKLEIKTASVLTTDKFPSR